MSRVQRTIAWCVAISFAALLAQGVLLLPPLEGFDEDAHYSYIALLADRGEIPDFRRTPMDASLALDRHGLPRPYSAEPPYELNGGITYRAFWQLPAAERESPLARWWQRPSGPTGYRPGTNAIWQGQHPPLYYALMTVPYRLTRDWSPGSRLLALRLASASVAFCGLVFWWLALRQVESAAGRWWLLGAGAVVLWLPSCWYDLGRLGNDSLVALGMAAAFYFLVVCLRQAWRSWPALAGLTLTLALGLWTKGFFVPVWAASLALALWGLVRVKGMSWWGRSCRVALLALVPLVLALPWMLWCQRQYGSPFPASDLYQLIEQGQAAGADLSPWAFCFQLLHGMASSCRTFLWCGTWCWVKRALWEYLLAAPLIAMAIGGWLRRDAWQDRSVRQLRLAALAMVGALALGFVHYYCLRIYWTGFGRGGGGYYYYVAWLAVGIFLAGGVLPGPSSTSRRLVLAAIPAIWLFEVMGIWFSMQIYAGVIVKPDPHGYGQGWIAPTPENVRLIFSRVGQLACPVWAVVAYLISVVGRATILALLVRPREAAAV